MRGKDKKMNEKLKADLLFAVTTIIVVSIVLAAFLALVHLSIESGKYHHDTRVGDVVQVLGAYEDCRIVNISNDDDSTRNGAYVLVLKCVK